MRNLFLCILLCLSGQFFAAGVCDGGDGDRIVGIYSTEYEGEESRISIFKEEDGTYSARVVWVKNKYDGNGNVRMDEKNPDKSRRNVPCDEIVLIESMSYNADRDTWGNAKVYDPTRGIRANVNCSFETPARLKVRGTVMGIGMSVYWDKIE